jgi:hypothetical protein
VDVTDAFVKVVHAMEYCDKERARYQDRRFIWYSQGYSEFKWILRDLWGVQGLLPFFASRCGYGEAQFVPPPQTGGADDGKGEAQ